MAATAPQPNDAREICTNMAAELEDWVPVMSHAPASTEGTSTQSGNCLHEPRMKVVPEGPRNLFFPFIPFGRCGKREVLVVSIPAD